MFTGPAIRTARGAVDVLWVMSMAMAGIVSARPSVALVGSGGGALGCTHIGILKALGAQRVPVDCVAGTSMSALAGRPDSAQVVIPCAVSVARPTVRSPEAE